jgi:hypothetical protein
MNWRDQRRTELQFLRTDDPAGILLRYYELTRFDGLSHPPPMTVSLAGMIELILDYEEQQRQFDEAAAAATESPSSNISREPSSGSV